MSSLRLVSDEEDGVLGRCTHLFEKLLLDNRCEFLVGGRSEAALQSDKFPVEDSLTMASTLWLPAGVAVPRCEPWCLESGSWRRGVEGKLVDILVNFPLLLRGPRRMRGNLDTVDTFRADSSQGTCLGILFTPPVDPAHGLLDEAGDIGDSFLPSLQLFFDF